MPQPCRSVQSAREFAVRAIEPSGVMLLEHPGRGVAEPERDQDRVRTGLQRQRRSRMHQLSEPKPHQSGARDRWAPDEPTEGRTPDFTPPRSALNTSPSSPRRIPSQVSASSSVIVCGNVTALRDPLGLRRATNQATGFDDLLLDADNVTNEVEAVDA